MRQVDRLQEKISAARVNTVIHAPFSEPLKKEIDNLYSNVFCSAARFSEVESLEHVAVWLDYKGNELLAAVLFRIEGRAVFVLNELIEFAEEVIETFTKFVFKAFPDAETVQFPSLRTRVSKISSPYQMHNATEDIVISLPAKVEDYNANLGSSTRSNLLRYQKRIGRDHGEMKFSIYEGPNIPQALLSKLIEFSIERMRKKDKVPAHTENSLSQLRMLVKNYGVVLVAQRHDVVCGGVICSSVGDRFFMHVISHDPSYDGVRLGLVCCYLSVCDALKRGARSYHLLSGEYEYKFRLQGKKVDFDRLVIFKSRMAVVRNFRLFTWNIVHAHGRSLKRLLRQRLRT